MNRIFPFLAAFALLFMGVNLVLGLSLGDLRDPTDRLTQQMATVHRLAGAAAALVVVLVNSIAATYFIGTSRWCKEVVEAYSLDPAPARQAAQSKRRAFPFAVMGMLTVVGIAALGAAGDPGATRQLEPIAGVTWAALHLTAALLGMALIAWAYFKQWLCMIEQREAIAAIMRQVRQARLDRGLEVEDAVFQPWMEEASAPRR